MPTTTDVIKTVLLEDEDLLRGLLSEWLSAQPDIEMLDSFRSIQAFHWRAIAAIQSRTKIHRIQFPKPFLPSLKN